MSRYLSIVCHISFSLYTIMYIFNCVTSPRENYADRVYTSAVAYPEMKHIDADAQEREDFSQLIEHTILKRISQKLAP